MLTGRKGHLKLFFLYSRVLGEAGSNIIFTGCRPWDDNHPLYGWLNRPLIHSQQMDLATRWCGFESPHWVSGFKSFSCVSTIFEKNNIYCHLNRIRITMETSSSMCLGGSFLIALVEVERPITSMSCTIPQYKCMLRPGVVSHCFLIVDAKGLAAVTSLSWCPVPSNHEPK